jgi:hypothetical protein
MTIHIVGAGMAGLLAANLLRHRDPVVLESQASLPNNHSAVLRFRTSAVADALGIPFRKVSVVKATLPWKNPVADALAYSKKNLGTYLSDRSISAQPSSTERWIAPPDLIEQMARRVDIRFGAKFDFPVGHPKVISTLPMPALMKALGYEPEPETFRWVSGVNVRAKINNADAYVTLNVPDPALAFSRVSITGDELIVELPGMEFLPPFTGAEWIAIKAADLLGIPGEDVHDVSWHRQAYAKIRPIDEHQRKSFIFWASSVTGRAFSLGRYATWRPGLLLDDLVKDVRLIDSWIASGTPGYEMDIHHARRAS